MNDHIKKARNYVACCDRDVYLLEYGILARCESETLCAIIFLLLIGEHRVLDATGSDPYSSQAQSQYYNTT